MWSISLGAPAECGAYGGFDPRWGRHSARALNEIDHQAPPSFGIKGSQFL